ncbi:hypothetical protein PO073_09830 [Bacteroides thetaiotaomicron]|uniref:hypothetical protein n=1 Tax=Bacteroides thetaiotaomicron TaxID=818 RepID=UPI0036F43CC7|nr:hypothetical protein [Bacteroides thetaiotaomicron]MDC2187947.1 hypothetical protein [Bacteroides thetaiotaomicron]
MLWLLFMPGRRAMTINLELDKVRYSKNTDISSAPIISLEMRKAGQCPSCTACSGLSMPCITGWKTIGKNDSFLSFSMGYFDFL